MKLLFKQLLLVRFEDRVGLGLYIFFISCFRFSLGKEAAQRQILVIFLIKWCLIKTLSSFMLQKLSC